MKHLLSILTVLTLSISVFAAPLEKPLLWKAQQGEKTVYLFGTFHFGFTLADLPQGVLDRVKQSQSFFMEADVSNIDPLKLQALGMLGEGQTLDQYLPEESWLELVALFSPFMAEDQLKLLKPWYVTTFLTLIATQQLGLEGTLDTELLDYAKTEGLQLGYLEKADLQFSVLEAISTIPALDKSLKESDTLIQDSVEDLTELHQCYSNSDLLCLTRLMGTTEQGGTQEPWQYQLLLSQRNKTWIPVIENAVEEGTAFVAVGAGHLVGEDNVLSLLELEGYKIERVEF